MKNHYNYLKVFPALAAFLLMAMISQNLNAQHITGQPRDVTISAGHSSSVFFTVETTSGIVFKYQWWRLAPGSVIPTVIKEATGPILEVPFTVLSPATTKSNGYSYYCVVDDGTTSQTSLKGYLWVQEVKESVIAKHPDDITQDVGYSGLLNYNVELEAGVKANFLWLKRLPRNDTWEKVGETQQFTEEVKELDIRQNGTAYRCLITSELGQEYSQVAYLWVKEPKVLILTEPVDVTKPEGFVGDVTLDITPNPKYPETTFQWEYKLPGGVWELFKGAEKPIFEFPIKEPLNEKLDGTAFRCNAVFKDIVEVSEPAYLHMEEVNKYILVDPVDVMKKQGYTGELIFYIKYDDSYKLAFQWQEKKPGGSWIDIDPSYHKGANGPELRYNVEKLTSDWNGWGFRCVAINLENKLDVEYSKEANLYVSLYETYFLYHPKNVTVCEGIDTDIKFAVEVVKEAGLSLQWQIAPAGEKTWYDIKGATSNLYVKSYTEVPLSHNGNAFRCKATDTYGGVEFSNIAFLYVRALPEITVHPESQEKMVGEAVTFNVTATGYKPFSYQWLKDNAAITGATSSSLSMFPLSETDPGDYKVIVSNYCLNSADTSDAATLIVNAPEFGDGWFEQEIVTSKRLTDIKFTGTNSGWVTVAPSNFIYKTADGGKNWSQESVTTSMSWEAVFTTDASNVWIAGEDSIKYSTSGGGSWNGATMTGVLSAINLYDLHFVDNSNGWAVGDNGLILNSTNGGDEWIEQHSGSKGGFVTDVNLSAVHFSNADTGWAVGAQGKILFTEDGGTTWAIQS